jgi:hypothetical protein
MCDACNQGGCFDRRDFLKVGGGAAALGSLWAMGAWAQSPADGGFTPAAAKRRMKVAVVFMYPPEEVVYEGRLEDSWAVNKWFTYPGNQYKPEKNHDTFRRKIEAVGKTYALDLDFRGVVYTKAQVAAFIDSTNAAPPDTLLIVNFWNTVTPWVLEMTRKMPLPTVVYHPVGSSHQHPPKELMSAEGVVYIHSLENWEALENALAAANAKHMMAQSRLLRVTEVNKQTVATDKNLGVEIIAIPAAEYNALFDAIAPDAALVREARAFKRKAAAVLDVEDRYIVDGFRARQAVLEIMSRYGADGITIKCLMLKERKPCIAFSLNNSALIPCACEDFPDSAMTLMIGAHLFRRGGFMHNPEFDIDRNRYYGAHCTCALEMHGPGKGELPFRIRPFTHQLPKTAAIDVKMPPGEKGIVTKYIPKNNSVFAYTGTMVGSPEITSAGGCATRFVMDLDKLDDVCSAYHGAHPILYLGSAEEAKRMKMFAKLAKLDFIGNV